MNKLPPVIAIDGPSASGKGTISQRVAQKLGFHYLDSGALYRIMALAALQNNVLWSYADGLVELAKSLQINFKDDEIYLNNNCVTQALRAENISHGASKVAVHPTLRQALLNLQYGFRQYPGLVADGRDMGSVVFKDARLKVFLTANVEIRAQRRYKQLTSKNLPSINLSNDNLTTDFNQILVDLRIRDERDSQRNAAPLLQTDDAFLLNTNNLSIDEAVDWVMAAYKKLDF